MSDESQAQAQGEAAGDGGAVLHKTLSYQVVGCAMKVHNELGPGFPEAVYHKALCMELDRAGVPHVSEARLEVRYDGQVCGEFRVDVLAADKIVLELKAVDALCQQHAAQVLSYLRAGGLRLGLLMNFGETRLDVRRIVN